MYPALYLVFSAGHCRSTYVLIPSMFSFINYFNFIPIRGDGFPFLSIYDPHKPTFQSHLVLLPSDVLLALLLVGDLSHLCIFYHHCKGLSKQSSWSCWILLVAWPGRNISGELCYIVTYADSHLHTCTYICRIIHNDTTTRTQE